MTGTGDTATDAMQSLGLAPQQSDIAPPSGAVVASGLALRPAGASDLPFLRRLHAEMRAPELSMFPWSPAEKAAFCNSQFSLQQDYYSRVFPDRGCSIVTHEVLHGTLNDVGRLDVDKKTPAWRIIDLILSAKMRERGIGSALIRWVQASASAADAQSVTLSVAINNRRAQALYNRLGFEAINGGDALNRSMRWRPLRILRDHSSTG